MEKPKSQHPVFKNICVAVLAILGFLAAQIAVAVIMILSVMGYHMVFSHMQAFEALDLGADYLLSHTITLLIVSEVLLLAVIALILRVRHISLADGIGLKPAPFGQLIFFFVLGFVLNFLIVWIISLIPFPESWISNYSEASSQLDQEGFLALAIATVLIAPITEEVIFRGIVYSRLRQIMPRFLAVLIESLIFGALHESPIWILYGTAMGIVLTLVYERKHNLACSMALHIGFNLIGIL